MRATTIARRSIAALIIAAAAAGCRVSDATAPLGPCSEPLTGLTVQIQTGQPTLFSWDPECTVGGVIIETSGTTSPGSDLWIIHDPKGRIEGPVAYGVTPSNASQVLDPLPLAAGQKYRVHLLDGTGVELYASDFTQQ